MIIAIERNAFNYVLKYNSISIPISQIIDLNQDSIDSLISEPTEFIIQEFDRILPVFEQDQEILLVEVEKSELTINGRINLPFKAITKIYPLTTKAKNVLSGKLNQNIQVDAPKFEKIIDQIKLLRAIKHRDLLIEKLFNILLITEKPKIKFTNDVQLIIKSLLKGNSSSNSFLSNLLSYNYNPNEISSGNIEYLEKIGIIAFIFKAKTSDGYTDSPFYKACERNKKEINKGSYADGYNKYFELLSNNNSDLNCSDSHNKINRIINEGIENVDVFKIAYYFLAIKTRLNKNETNLLELYQQIIEDLFYDKNMMIHVLYLIGYTFSFEQLYESIHILEKAPLLKNKFITADIASIHEKLAEIEAKNKLKTKNQEVTVSPEMSIKGNESDINISEEEVSDSENKNVRKSIINSNNSNTSEEKSITNENKDKEEVEDKISEQNITESGSNNLTDLIKKPEEIIDSGIKHEQESENSNLEEKKTDVSITINDFHYTDGESSDKIISDPQVVYEDKSFSGDQLNEKDKRIKVSDFKIWVLNAAPSKPKKANWEKFILTRFPSQDKLITIEDLATEITNYPGGDDLYTKKDAKNAFTGADILEYFKTKGE